VSDQFDDSESQSSHEADIDAGFDDDQGDTRFPPAGVADAAENELDDEQPETSHDADVAAGYDEET
jgi:hypothetical protein